VIIRTCPGCASSGSFAAQEATRTTVGSDLQIQQSNSPSQSEEERDREIKRVRETVTKRERETERERERKRDLRILCTCGNKRALLNDSCLYLGDIVRNVYEKLAR
jgi:hypothetical protein